MSPAAQPYSRNKSLVFHQAVTPDPQRCARPAEPLRAECMLKPSLFPNGSLPANSKSLERRARARRCVVCAKTSNLGRSLARNRDQSGRTFLGCTFRRKTLQDVLLQGNNQRQCAVMMPPLPKVVIFQVSYTTPGCENIWPNFSFIRDGDTVHLHATWTAFGKKKNSEQYKVLKLDPETPSKLESSFSSWKNESTPIN